MQHTQQTSQEREPGTNTAQQTNFLSILAHLIYNVKRGQQTIAGICPNSTFAHTYHVGPSVLMSPNNHNSIYNLLLFIRIIVVLSGTVCKRTLKNAVLGDFSALLEA